jgi:hypothetical protein
MYKGKKYTFDPYYSTTVKMWICTLRDENNDKEVSRESGYGMTMHSAVDDAFYKLAFSKVDYK